MKIHHLFFLLYITGHLISCNAQEKKKTTDETPIVTGKEVIGQLESASFFNITDEDKIGEAKTDMISSYDKHDYFGGFTYTDSLAYVDHRFYFVDQEELFEIGGLTKYLNDVKTTFNLLGLKLEFTNENNHEESFKGNFWEHTIELNGNEYTAFKGEIGVSSWGIAMVNFAIMLNDQLKLQNSDEQVYLIYSGNDGMLVFLTPQMFVVVEKNYPDEYNRPMTVQQWKKYYKID